MATTESSASFANARPPTEEQDHPHACLNGYIYLGYTYTSEDGDEVEAFEAIPCRRCADDVQRS